MPDDRLPEPPDEDEHIEGCPSCGGELSHFEHMLRCSRCGELFDNDEEDHDANEA